MTAPAVSLEPGLQYEPGNSAKQRRAHAASGEPTVSTSSCSPFSNGSLVAGSQPWWEDLHHGNWQLTKAIHQDPPARTPPQLAVNYLPAHCCLPTADLFMCPVFPPICYFAALFRIHKCGQLASLYTSVMRRESGPGILTGKASHTPRFKVLPEPSRHNT